MFTDYNLLVDIGISYKLLETVINDINYVFITHIHGDHLNKSTVKRLAKDKPLITFIVGVHLLEALIDLDIPRHRIMIVESGKAYVLNNELKFDVIDLYHDVSNMGLRMRRYCDKRNRYIKTIYATDTSHLDGISALNYDYYFLEENYCEDKANKIIRLANRKRQFTHVNNSIHNHMSTQYLDLYMAKNNRNGKGKLIRLHQSSTAL